VHPGDFEWWIATSPDADWVSRIALWEAPDGRLLGWTFHRKPPPGELDWFVHPDHRDDALRRRMLDWFEQRVAEDAASGSSPDRLTVWAADSDQELMRLLEREGFERSQDWYTHRARPLSDGGGEPVDPAPGYTVRQVDADADIAARVDVHRAAFAPSAVTVDAYRRVMSSATYRPELDLVAVAPDGAFGAFCIVWLDEPTRIALFEPVGTHPEHRRRGLARAVCREGLRRAAALGAEAAIVLAWNGEDAANRLYESLGFRDVMRSYRYRREYRQRRDVAA
jgi:GNAT superfamily N-acetyltransferase